MKTAAVVIVVAALVGLFHKEKKRPQPPPPVPVPITTTAPATTAPVAAPGGSCAAQIDVFVDERAQRRIVRFGMQLYRTPRVTQEEMERIAYYIVAYSTYYGIEPEFAAALIGRESGFNPRAVSANGAKGLGQLIDSTARLMGIGDPFDPQQNLCGSIGYLRMMMDKWAGYEDQADRALASYLQGPRTVESAGGVPDSAKPYINDIYAYREKMRRIMDR